MNGRCSSDNNDQTPLGEVSLSSSCLTGPCSESQSITVELRDPAKEPINFDDANPRNPSSTTENLVMAWDPIPFHETQVMEGKHKQGKEALPKYHNSVVKPSTNLWTMVALGEAAYEGKHIGKGLELEHLPVGVAMTVGENATVAVQLRAAYPEIPNFEEIVVNKKEDTLKDCPLKTRYEASTTTVDSGTTAAEPEAAVKPEVATEPEAAASPGNAPEPKATHSTDVFDVPAPSRVDSQVITENGYMSFMAHDTLDTLIRGTGGFSCGDSVSMTTIVKPRELPEGTKPDHSRKKSEPTIMEQVQENGGSVRSERDCQDSARALTPTGRGHRKNGSTFGSHSSRPKRGNRAPSVCSEESWQSTSFGDYLKRHVMCFGKTGSDTPRRSARPPSAMFTILGRRFSCCHRIPEEGECEGITVATGKGSFAAAVTGFGNVLFNPFIVNCLLPHIHRKMPPEKPVQFSCCFPGLPLAMLAMPLVQYPQSQVLHLLLLT